MVRTGVWSHGMWSASCPLLVALVVAALVAPPAAALSVRPLISASGQGSDDRFGSSVAGAGDFNGDGYQDLLVGAFAADTTDVGRAFMYFGGPKPDSVPDLVFDILEPLQYPYAWMGWSVAGAGDFNGDGFSDVIIGAPAARPLSDPSALGMAFVYFGGPVPDAVPDLVLKAEHNGTFSNASFGWSVAGAGDVNGDGFDDVIVGAPGQRRGSHVNIGSAYVFFGGPGADDRPDMTFNGGAENDEMGYSVSGAGDVNGDGYPDVIAGGPQHLEPNRGPGRAWLFFGGPVADQVADLVLSGEVVGDEFGSALASAGDVNGDGFDDVILGAPYHQAGNNYGRAYVFFGGATPGATPGLVMTGINAEFLGTGVAPALDVNRDGYDDVMTGGIYGYLDIFYGGPSADAVPDLVIEPPSPASDHEFGHAVAAVGDMNGNGHGDFAVGAPGAYTDAVPTGRAYVFDVVPVVAVGPSPPARFEFSAPWPNPATGWVRLAFTVPIVSRVQVSVQDVSGREVARPIAGERLSGRVTREWRPDRLPSGIYFVRARVEGREQVRKLVWAGSR